LIQFAILNAITAYIVYVTAWYKNSLRTGFFTFLIMMALFAPLKMQLPHGVVINATLIFGTPLSCCVAMLAINMGIRYVIRSAMASVMWLVYIQISIMVLNAVPNAVSSGFGSSNYDIHTVVFLLNNNTMHAFLATYVSFVIKTTVIFLCLHLVQTLPRFWKYIISLSIAHAIGGIIFYLIVFGSGEGLSEIWSASTVMKIVLSILYYPIIRKLRTNEFTE
jgi:hypothetical protein